MNWDDLHQNTNTERQQRLQIIRDSLIAMCDLFGRNTPSHEDLARKSRVFNHALHDIPQGLLKRCFWEASKKGKFPTITDIVAVYAGERKVARPNIGCNLCEADGRIGLRRVFDMRSNTGYVVSYVCECAVGKLYNGARAFPMKLPMGMVPYSKEAEKEFYGW